jgi:hypothetical protein
VKRVIVGFIAAVFAIVMFAGCSSISTAPDEAGLHYKGGPLSSEKFANCVDSSNRNLDGPGDKHYVYPKGQRTFSFTGKEGAETDPIPVTTGSQEVLVGGFVTFTLNTDCKILQEFHEKVGKKYKAYKDGGGWDDFLNDYIYVPLNATLNEAAGSIKVPEGQTADQNWYRLYTSAEVQKDFEEYVKENLPSEIEATLGEDYITVNAVSIAKPTVSDSLKDALAEKEQARLENDAQKERNAQVRTQFDTVKDCLETGLSEQSCTLIFLEQSGADIPFLPVPQGGAVNYQSVQ